MIEIKAYFGGENVTIAIDDGGLTTRLKDKRIASIIEEIYSDALDEYSPSDGSFGAFFGQVIEQAGGKAIEVVESEVQEGVVY